MDTFINKQQVSELTNSELLKRSSEYIFSTGMDDGAARLCKANMKYGLAQFHLIQEKYGFEPKANFISTPDETISRNEYRWKSGLGYGGRLNWGNGAERLIFLNIKPNCCGILVGGLDDVPEPYDIIKKIDEIKTTDLYHNDVLINWDYGIANHFINCFETKNLSDMKLPPYIFLIHGSAPEYRDDKYGIGLYIDRSKTLKEIAIEESTRFGKQYILTDSEAKEYIHFNKVATKFSNEKREIIARLIFGSDFKKICNQPHQFMKDYNNIYLGTNCTDLSTDLIDCNIFPIALRADIDAYLFRGKRNFSETTLKNIDLYKRAESLGLLDLLKTADILPHGGGYMFPDIASVQKVMEHKDQRYFTCELKSDKNRLKIIRNMRDLQFVYRGRDIVLKTVQLDLGELVAQLSPIFSLKL